MKPKDFPNKTRVDDVLAGIEVETTRVEKFLTTEETRVRVAKIEHFAVGKRGRGESAWSAACADLGDLLDMLPDNIFGFKLNEARKLFLMSDQTEAINNLSRELYSMVHRILSSKPKTDSEKGMVEVFNAFDKKIKELKDRYSFLKSNGFYVE